jgi:hypothetical protein
MSNPEAASSIYKALTTERDTFVEEAHRSAQVTIPAIRPNTDDVCTENDPQVLAKPFQSLGARGVNNLASTITLALFPPSVPFFKYELTGQTYAELKELGVDPAEVESVLATRESRIQDEVDGSNLRTKTYQMIRHLLVTGNVMAYRDPSDGQWQLYPLTSYVCKRDGRGNLLDLIYVDKLDRRTIEDPRVLKALESDEHVAGETTVMDPAKSQVVPVFTRVRRVSAKKFESWQEVGVTEIQGTRQTHSADTLPWLVLTYTLLDGEDYGRGFVEEYRGDLTTYENISRDMTFASANAAKVVWAINPTSPLKPRAFEKVANGGAVAANPEDVQAIQLNKSGDMSVVFQFLADIKQALAADFLLNASFQRNQERVTAEEVRLMAQELDDSLGGVFSQLTQEIQLPVARLLEKALTSAAQGFPSLPDGTVKLTVVTGLAAIGRGHELQTLRSFLGMIAEAAQVVPGTAEYVMEEGLASRIATGSGVDPMGLLKSADEVAAERQAAQQAMTAQTVGSELARGAGNAVGGMDPQQMAEQMAAMQQG